MRRRALLAALASGAASGVGGCVGFDPPTVFTGTDDERTYHEDPVQSRLLSQMVDRMVRADLYFFVEATECDHGYPTVRVPHTTRVPAGEARPFSLQLGPIEEFRFYATQDMDERDYGRNPVLRFRNWSYEPDVIPMGLDLYPNWYVLEACEQLSISGTVAVTADASPGPHRFTVIVDEGPGWTYFEQEFSVIATS